MQGTRRTTINLSEEACAALDELAERYGTKTKALTQAIHNELERERRSAATKEWVAEFCAEHDITITDADREWAERAVQQAQA